jgi:hypothetical protein
VHDEFNTDVYAVLAAGLRRPIPSRPVALRYDREERDVDNLVP